MFRKFLKANSPQNFFLLNWMRKINGVVRVVVFDDDSNKVFVIAYLEQENQYSIFAFDRVSGQSYWIKNVVQGGYGAPAILNKIVICPTKFTNIIALSKEDGSEQWVFQTPYRVRSSINVIGNQVYFSSGNSIFEVSECGKLLNTWRYAGAFFYGPIDIINDLIITLGVIENEEGESTIKVFAFRRQGELAYARSISISPIVSSDTCGIAWENGLGFIGGDEVILCFEAEKGEILWTSNVQGFAGRQICTVSHNCVYYTTLSGVVGALSAVDGNHLWEIKTTDQVIVSPISVLNDNLILIADAHLNVLNSRNGQLLQKFPVGHSPYSMLSLDGKYGLLGAGEPPHNGLLFGFKLDDVLEEKYVCYAHCSNGFLEEKSLDILIKIHNFDQEIIEARLDGSIFHLPEISGEKVNPFSFTFRAPLSRSICSGDYVIPLFLHLKSGMSITRPVLLTFARREPLPRKGHLNFVPDIKQEQPTFSGAAIGATVREIYGNQTIDQSAIREMVDACRILGQYEPHDTWRIILRRVLTSSALKKEDMPEFKS